MVSDETLSEEKKLEIFNASFSNLTSLTIDLISDSIYKVWNGDEEVTDKNHIKEFVYNADKDIIQKIQSHLDEMKKHNNLEPLTFTTTEEQQSRGAPVTYTLPISFNETDFFAQGF